jgi:hypothetical protein
LGCSLLRGYRSADTLHVDSSWISIFEIQVSAPDYGGGGPLTTLVSGSFGMSTFGAPLSHAVAHVQSGGHDSLEQYIVLGGGLSRRIRIGSSFSRVFKREMGEAPMKYRRKCALLQSSIGGW